MKLTEREQRILFEALTLYKALKGLSTARTLEQRQDSDSVSSLRSKLKKLIKESNESRT